ncbi:MAG: hypothetical protein FWG85_02520 [Bacteroidetes bacterium]|nr:hypothetical protein [Bacteroidota bacterium]
MNRFITLLIVFTFAAATLTTTTNAAEYTTSKSKVVSVDPLDLINGRINATFENKMSAKNSFTVNASYWSYWDWLSAMGIGGSYRWYIDPFEEGKSALNGLSLGPRVDMFYWSSNFEYDDPWVTLAIGAEVNYKWAFGDGGKWSVEPTIKFMFPVVKGKKYTYYTNYGFGVNLGYAF